jgi:PAS domain S-box-containing protein
MKNDPLGQRLPDGNDEELALLYQLGIALASGKDLFTTLHTLQTAILKLIQVQAMFIAIYDEVSDMVDFSIYFEVGEPERQASRRLSENPGLTGAVIHSGKTLYLPDMMIEEVVDAYTPVEDDRELVLHTFLGIPLTVNDKVIGVLSVQSTRVDAYSADQIQLMENVAVQASLAIDKSRLLDQLKKELDERKKIEVDLRQRESILEAVTFAAEEFLKTSNWRLNINHVLERFGITMHVTHAYLFEDHLNTQGEPVTSMRYEWTAPGYPSFIQSPFFQNSKIEADGYQEQAEALYRGEVRAGNSSTFNAIEKEAMDSFGIKAILEVPIFINKKSWGAIGFDDYEQQRQWTSAEVDALKVAADILGAAIQREQADSAVQESERIYRQAIEAADAVPYFQDYATNSYLFIGEGIHAMTGYGPHEITPDTWIDLVEETVMLGDAAGYEVDGAIEAVRNGTLKAWKCDQKIRTRDGQIRWLTDRSIELLDAQNISHGSIGILQDITDRKLIEAGMHKRESMLEAVTFSAEQFLKNADWRENIEIVLERLGREFDATHAYFFEHHTNSQGQVLTSMKYEWTADGYPSDLENAAYQGARIRSELLNSTDDILGKGIVFIGNSFSYPDVEKERLVKLGVKALIEVPLMVKGEWWGTIGLDDMRLEREWNPAELDALKIAAGILSAAIQRQQAESAVQESERIYRRAIEAAGAVPYFRHHDLNKYIFVGEGILEITGYSPKEMTPKLWGELVISTELSGELAGLTEEEAVPLARHGKVKAWKCDYCIRTRNGQRRWIADSAVELFGESGVSYGSIGIMQDVTERKDVEANLRQRESLLQALTFSAEQFLKTTNWRDSIDLVLERLGTEFNVSHAYLFEKHPDDSGQIVTSMRYEWTAPKCISDLDDPRFQNIDPSGMGFERFYEILDSGKPLVGDHSFFNELEKQYVESLGIHALLEIRVVVNGKQWGTLGVDEVRHERLWSNVEIDVLKVAASMLGAAIKRQEDESALQGELSQRKTLIEELESKNQELERFTYTVSHDLKSPLVTISGFLGYLEQDALTNNLERLRQDTGRIQEAVVKMQRLLNELLELSRIGRLMNTPQVLPFEDLVGEAMAVVHGQLKERGITVQIQPGLPTVCGDKPRLVEVLQNLLDNASKYMGSQPNPLIEIGHAGEENNNPVFYVRDNGIGIASAHHERIFGLFNKLDVRSEGTGVGLALVKRIVEIHGGRIWVESEEGRGSKFLFTLPAQPH